MRHKKVQVVLINQEAQKLFLFQVSLKRGSFWQNITGSVDNAEEIDDAAMRELTEESSLIANKLVRLPHYTEFRDRWNRDVQEYSYLALTDQERVVLSDEHQSYKLVPLHEVNKEMFNYQSNYEAFLDAKRWLSK